MSTLDVSLKPVSCDFEVVMNAVRDIIKVLQDLAARIIKVMTDAINALQTNQCDKELLECSNWILEKMRELDPDCCSDEDHQTTGHDKNHIRVSKIFTRDARPLRNYIMDLSQYNRKIMKSRCKIV